MPQSIASLLALLSLVCATVHAQPQPQPAPTDPAVYRAFGEKPGLVRLMDDFMQRIEADARLGPQFAKSDKKRVKEQLVDQICQVTGGPCAYRGADMKSAHSNMDVNKGDFNRLVEVLQESMAAQGVPFRAQNQLLAKLAPMHRDIINTP